MREAQLKMVKGLLNEYGHAWTNYGIEKIVDNNIAQKSEIIKFMERFPTYEADKMRVRFEVEIEPIMNKRDIKRHLDKIASTLTNANSTLTPLFNTIALLYNDEKTINEFYKMTFERYGVKVGLNTKFSRALYKVVTTCYNDYKVKHGSEFKVDYNMAYNLVERLFAELSDMLNVKKDSYTFYIGCSTYDFLRMSSGNSWGSCHSIRPSYVVGSYSSGTLSYAGDVPSFLFYREASHKHDLICRQHGLIDELKIGIGRKYGDCSINDIAWQKVCDIIAETYNTKIETWNSHREYGRTARGSTQYCDYEGYSLNYAQFEIPISGISDGCDIGSEPICPECGDRHNKEEQISCCTISCHCEHCGTGLDEDDGYFIHDGYYCSDCVDELFVQCRHCGDWERKRDYDCGFWHDEYVCDYCIRMHDYTWCESCGEMLRHGYDDIHMDDESCVFCEGCKP